MRNVSAPGGAGLLPGISQPELVRLLLQSVRDLGYDETAEVLQRESGVELQSGGAEQLRDAIRRGRYAQALELLPSLSEDARQLEALVREFEYVERLERGDVHGALRCLQVAPAAASTERVKRLSALLLCKSAGDVREQSARVLDLGPLAHEQQAAWLACLRGTLLHLVSAHLPPGSMLPEQRLQHLLLQAVDQQRDKCLYHNVLSYDTSLLRDHRCTQDGVPACAAQVLDAHRDEVWYVQWSHNGRMLAASGKDCRITVWRLQDGGDERAPLALHCELTGHREAVSYLSWSPDDALLVSAGNDGYALVWNTETGACEAIVSRGRGERLLIGGAVAVGGEVQQMEHVAEAGPDVDGGGDNDDENDNDDEDDEEEEEDDDGDDDDGAGEGHSGAGRQSQEEQQLQQPSWRRLVPVGAHGARTHGSLFIGAFGGPRGGGLRAASLPGVMAAAAAVQRSSAATGGGGGGGGGGSAASGASAGGAIGAAVGGGHGVGSLCAVAWLPDSAHFVIGVDRRVEMVDVTGRLLWTISCNGAVNDVLICAPESGSSSAPDVCRMIVLLQSNTVCVYTLSKASADAPPAPPPVGVDSAVVPAELAWRPSVHDSVVLCDETEWHGHTRDAFSLSYCGFRHVLVNTASEVHLWNIDERRIEQLYRGHKQSRFVIRACAGGAHLAFIASGSEDSRVYVWHRRSGAQVHVLEGHSGVVNCVAWNPRFPELLASASDDGTVRIWRASVEVGKQP